MPRTAFIVATIAAAASSSGSLAETIKSDTIRKPGIRRGDDISMSVTYADGSSTTFYAHAKRAGEVIFSKPDPGYTSIKYRNETRDRNLNALGIVQGDLDPYLLPGMRMPLFDFEDVGLETAFDFTEYSGNANSLLGMQFMIDDGHVMGLAGIQVLHDGVPWDGLALVTGENLVTIVPAPTTALIPTLALAGLISRRRR